MRQSFSIICLVALALVSLTVSGQAEQVLKHDAICHQRVSILEKTWEGDFPWALCLTDPTTDEQRCFVLSDYTLVKVTFSYAEMYPEDPWSEMVNGLLDGRLVTVIVDYEEGDDHYRPELASAHFYVYLDEE